jgi:7-cyano-7-deazaguanine reductase
MLERFTDRARKVMALANLEAQRLHHEYIATEHIMLGIVEEGAGVAVHVLKELGQDLDRIRNQIAGMIQPGEPYTAIGKLPQTPRVRRVIEFAIKEARAHHHHHVGTEHLLIGLMLADDGVAARALNELGLDLEHVRRKVHEVLGEVGEGGTSRVRVEPELIETFDNPHAHRHYLIEHVAAEFSSLCPKTGQPDFGTVTLRYIADRKCVELKSLKMYLQSYRNAGIFYEDVTNRILDDLVAACSPRWMEVETEWSARGGISSIITAEHGHMAADDDDD